jgi:hypothetical protein
MAVCGRLFQLKAIVCTGWLSGLNSLAEKGLDGSEAMSNRTVVAFGMLSAGYIFQLIGFAFGSVNSLATGVA